MAFFLKKKRPLIADAHSKSIDDYRIICERLRRAAFHKYEPGHSHLDLLWPTQTQKYSPRSGQKGGASADGDVWLCFCAAYQFQGISTTLANEYIYYIYFLVIFFFGSTLLAERLRGMMNEPTGPVTLRSPSGGLSDEVNFVSTLWLFCFLLKETFRR